jgi:hypothetical protein
MVSWRSYRPRFRNADIVAGVGKTILRLLNIADYLTVSSIAVNHLQSRFANVRDVGLACIYFNYQEPITPNEFLGNLSKQILQQSEDSSPKAEVLDFYRKHKSRDTKATFSQHSAFLHLLLKPYSKFFIVVDALDECGGENEGLRILSELHRIPNVQLMVTGRYHVEKILARFTDIMGLPIRARDEDISKATEVRIGESVFLSECVSKPDPTLRQTIIDAVVDKAKGMYVHCPMCPSSDETGSSLPSSTSIFWAPKPTKNAFALPLRNFQKP